MTGKVNAVVTERSQFDIKWEVMNEMSLKSREEFPYYSNGNILVFKYSQVNYTTSMTTTE